MSVVTNFSTIYEYFYSQCTDEETTQTTTIKCDKFIKSKFANFITYIDNDATIDYTAKTITTTVVLTEDQYNLLGLWMYEKLKEDKVTKHSSLANLVSDSHKISGMGDVKKALREDLLDVKGQINDKLATLL